MFTIWNPDSKRSIAAIPTLTLRLTQIACCVPAICCCIALSINSEYYDYGIGQLSSSAAWSLAVIGTSAGLALFWVGRPLELWPLPLVIDGISWACVVTGFTCLVVVAAEYDGQDALWIVPVILLGLATPAHLVATQRTLRLRRERTRPYAKPDDPLKPYLMKQEVDVWCYPVQPENGPSSEQHIHVPTPSEIERAAPVNEVFDQPKPPSMRPLSLAETAAVWSVLSQAATLPASQMTALPQYARSENTINKP